MEPNINSFTDWQLHQKHEQLREEARQEFLNSDLMSVLNLIMRTGADFTKHTTPTEGDITGDIEVTLPERDVNFRFTLQGELRHIGNLRPRSKPSPLAGACALKVA